MLLQYPHHLSTLPLQSQLQCSYEAQPFKTMGSLSPQQPTTKNHGMCGGPKSGSSNFYHNFYSIIQTPGHLGLCMQLETICSRIQQLGLNKKLEHFHSDFYKEVKVILLKYFSNNLNTFTLKLQIDEVVKKEKSQC